VLRRLTKDDALAEALSKDPDNAELEPRMRALVDYALKLTRTPSRMAKEDVEALRRAGLTDLAVIDAAHVAGYFNFINRLNEGLGVELKTPSEDSSS
jgi:uncharacterized peroxidase-related enzyme